MKRALKRGVRSKLYWAMGLLACAAALVFFVAGPQGISADQGQQAVSGAPQSFQLDRHEAEVRTPEEMKAADASGLGPAKPAAVRFRPTVQDENAYRALKEQAAKLAPGTRPAAPSAEGPLAVIEGTNCAGQAQAGLFPPDTHGAIGTTHYAQIVNSRYIVYTRASLTGDFVACGPPVLNVSLNAFFGYAAQTLFDPRVVYDHVYNRFIVSAEAFPESATVQRQFIAVSTSSNAAGSYFKYNFDVNIFNNSEFWDYPQLGFDDTAILMTANIFNPGYVGSRIFQISKHRMYAGKSVVPCIWFGGPLNFGTIAPPIVRDLNAQTWFVSANTADNRLVVTRWTAMDRFCGIFLGSQSLPVTAYVAPADAPQPGTAQVLDTLDARFVNSSTQRGSFLYNVHSVEFGGAAVRFYKLNVPANVATQNITFFSSGISRDFNASVAVNDATNANIFITFSRSDTATFPQVRFANKLDSQLSFVQGTAFTSPSSLIGNLQGTRQRWGDYSAINIDPTNQTRAWGTNESVAAGGGSWTSRIFKIRP